MNECTAIRESLTALVEGKLDGPAAKTVRLHLEKCSGCRKEYESLTLMHAQLGKLPEYEPGPALRNRFYTMLAEEKKTAASPRIRPHLSERINSWLALWWPRQPVTQFASALLFLAAGVGVGLHLQAVSSGHSELGEMRLELQSMRQMVSLTLLGKQSSLERLQAVQMTSSISRPDQSLLTGLVKTLNEDPSINVRLAAAEALGRYTNREDIRNSLEASLPRQTSPLVQIILIDVLTGLNDETVTRLLEELLKDATVAPEVKEYMADKLNTQI